MFALVLSFSPGAQTGPREERQLCQSQAGPLRPQRQEPQTSSLPTCSFPGAQRGHVTCPKAHRILQQSSGPHPSPQTPCWLPLSPEVGSSSNLPGRGPEEPVGRTPQQPPSRAASRCQHLAKLHLCELPEADANNIPVSQSRKLRLGLARLEQEHPAS